MGCAPPGGRDLRPRRQDAPSCVCSDQGRDGGGEIGRIALSGGQEGPAMRLPAPRARGRQDGRSAQAPARGRTMDRQVRGETTCTSVSPCNARSAAVSAGADAPFHRYRWIHERHVDAGRTRDNDRSDGAFAAYGDPGMG